MLGKMNCLSCNRQLKQDKFIINSNGYGFRFKPCLFCKTSYASQTKCWEHTKLANSINNLLRLRKI